MKNKESDWELEAAKTAKALEQLADEQQKKKAAEYLEQLFQEQQKKLAELLSDDPSAAALPKKVP